MPNTRSIQFSFAGGEVSPDMYGRIDQKSFQTGLKKCKNAIVRPQGPIKRRPGLSYCAETSDSNTRSRLIQLQTNPQTIMEVKSDHVRFLRNGAVLPASDANTNVSYGTVREYVAPKRITWLAGTGPGGTSCFRSGTYGSATAANHGFVDNDVVVFSWGGTAANMPPNTTHYGLGYYYHSFTLTETSSHNRFENTYTLDNASIAAGLRTGSIVINFYNDFGYPGYSAYYVTLSGLKMSLTKCATSGGFESLPTRRGTYVERNTTTGFTLYPGILQFLSVLTHLQQPDTTPNLHNADHQVYYVKVVDAQHFQVCLEPNGAPLVLTAWNAPGVSKTLPDFVMRTYNSGDCFSSGGSNYYVRSTFYAQQQTFNAVSGPHASKVYNMGSAGDLRVALPITYSEDEVQQLNYAVSNDIVTLAHGNRATVDVVRRSDRDWITTVAVNNLQAINDGVSGYNRPRTLIMRGARWNPDSVQLVGDPNAWLRGPRSVPFVFGDYVVKITSPTSINPYSGVSTYVVSSLSYPDNRLQDIRIATLAGSQYQIVAGDENHEYETVPSSDVEALLSTYQVAAIDVNGVESFNSLSVMQLNNLSNRGAQTWLRWPPLPNAVQYRIYKQANGIFGWVGDTNNLYWVDENYDADVAQRPVLYDYSYGTNGQYAQAVSYFEQRRVYGGSTLYPSRIWMTRSNTLYDFGYSIPVKDTDRIVIEMAARQTERIRHLVPLGDLMVLTDQGEWQLSPVNSDAITPTTISVRKQSNFGANYTVPVAIGQTAVYVTARGGHARELGYSNDQRGYVTGDLSLRAAHLFDGKDLIDLDCIKSPFPVLWFVSTDGKLKALTYIPDEKIYAWHEHETDGVFESAAAITEGTNDVLYAVVRRTINGSTKRYIERLAPLQEFGDTDVYLDSSLSGDGTNTSATTMLLTETAGQGWTIGSFVTVTRSTGAFVSTDVNDYLVVYDATGAAYRLEILSVGSPTTTAQARILDAIPDTLRGTATASWAFARNQWSGLSHLEGKTVSIWADGVMQASKVVASGSITIDTPAIKVRIGLPYTTTVETLPIALQADAFGQGRTKNVNKVWVRMQGTQEFQIGPTTSDLVSSGTLPSGQTDGELQVTLLPAWSQDGSIVMQQSDAFPMNINGLTLEAAIGS